MSLIRLLIVGFDPGEKAGLALIDTFGRLILLTSKSSASLSHFSQIILKYGKPIIVATDRKPTPKSVEKLAKSLGAKIYTPSETLTVKEKNDMVKRYEINVKNDHERDAVTAALKAYKHYVSLFKKVNISLHSLGLNNIYSNVVESLVFGKAENLDEAINKALSFNKEEVKVVKHSSKTEKKVDVGRLEKDLEILRKYNERLKEEIKRLKMKPKIKVVIPKKELDEMNKTLEFIKALRRLELQGFIPIIEVNFENAEDIDKKIDLMGRVVHCEENNLEFLNKYQVKALISFKEISIGKLDYPVIVLDEKELKEKDGIKYIEKEILEEKLKEARKKGLIEWIKDYKKRRI
ncbi:MAG: DUF460 domain-containing protein [Candidatus Aenigmatarchaeota archaeon]